jgi:anti-sigma factor RsiW
MTCDEATRLTAAAGGRELSPANRRLVDAHLAECGACRAEIAGQEEVAALLRSRPPLDVSPAFTRRVLDRVAAVPAWADVIDFRKWTWRLSPVAAALLLAALLLPSNRAATTSVEARPSNEPAIGIMESWVTPTNASTLPATALLWQPNVSNDALLVTVLTASPDAELGGTSLGR